MEYAYDKLIEEAMNICKSYEDGLITKKDLHQFLTVYEFIATMVRHYIEISEQGEINE